MICRRAWRLPAVLSWYEALARGAIPDALETLLVAIIALCISNRAIAHADPFTSILSPSGGEGRVRGLSASEWLLLVMRKSISGHHQRRSMVFVGCRPLRTRAKKGLA